VRLDKLVARNIWQHRVSSGLTTLNVALGALLVSVILLLRAATADTFLGPSRGFSLVVGAPGSGLQLVLNTVFHMGQSPGLLDYDVFEELERLPSTQLAVPYAVGDAFRGYRVVGTTEAFFEPRFPYPRADSAQGKLASGRVFHFDREALHRALRQLITPAAERGATSTAAGKPPWPQTAGDDVVDEAVIGAGVAAALDIRVGDRIEPTHGVEASGTAHREAQLWQVVGILRPSGTPVDNLVLINLDSFFRISDHRGGVIPETGKPAISAVVLFPKPGVHKALLLSQLNKRAQLQVADVDGEVHQLLAIVGNVDQIFLILAVLVVLIGVVSVAVAIYNTLTARQRELAILRILGARRFTVFGMLVGEATALSAVGAAIGLGAGHAVVWAAAGLVERSAGFRPSAAVFLPEELLAYSLVVLAGALGGLLPAFKAYRSDPASRLSPVA
jgi:putative ABC transport system permease protein